MSKYLKSRRRATPPAVGFSARQALERARSAAGPPPCICPRCDGGIAEWVVIDAWDLRRATWVCRRCLDELRSGIAVVRLA
jgi:hypothetical protein